LTTVWLDGLALSEKSGVGAGLTTRVALVVRVSAPLTPVIVSG
jgi:hypothetical protein